MEPAATPYDDRYLAGILLFNRHDFFEAHEVWEGLWLDHPGPEKRFVQGLIQAAVGLLHFSNGNVKGAVKLYHSSRAYMERYGSSYLGLDIAGFWRRMEQCFAPIIQPEHPDRTVELDLERVPVIVLEPPPDRWPDPDDFVDREE